LSGDDIINICQWNEHQDSNLIAGCPSNTLSALEAIKRFSKWVELNLNNWDQISDTRLKFAISPGNETTYLSIKSDWQKNAFVFGKWPNSAGNMIRPIYKIETIGSIEKISQNRIKSCHASANGCEIQRRLLFWTGHTHHMHMEIKE